MKKLWFVLVLVAVLCLGCWAGADGTENSYVRTQIMDSGAYISVPVGTEKLANTLWTIPVNGEEKIWFFCCKHMVGVQFSEPAFESPDFTVTSSTIDGVTVRVAERITGSISEIHMEYFVGKYRYNIDVKDMSEKGAAVFQQIRHSLSFGEEGGTRLPGDADGNSSVTLADVRAILSGNVSSEANADVTGDGNVNEKDVLRIMQYISGWDVLLE